MTGKIKFFTNLSFSPNGSGNVGNRTTTPDTKLAVAGIGNIVLQCPSIYFTYSFSLSTICDGVMP